MSSGHNKGEEKQQQDRHRKNDWRWKRGCERTLKTWHKNQGMEKRRDIGKG